MEEKAALRHPIFKPVDLPEFQIGADTGKPFQSKLNPFLREIYELRGQAPPVSYQEIARLLKERHGVEVSANGVFSFVKARSRPRAVYTIAPAFVAHAPGLRPAPPEPSPAPSARRPRYSLGEDF